MQPVRRCFKQALKRLRIARSLRSSPCFRVFHFLRLHVLKKTKSEAEMLTDAILVFRQVKKPPTGEGSKTLPEALFSQLGMARI